MKKLLSRLLWVPVGLVLVVFLVSNRQMVSVSLDPFSVDNPAIGIGPAPLWIWLIVMLFVGYVLGAASTWFGGRGRRKLANQERKALKAAEAEIATLKAGVAPGSTENLPVLEAS